IQCNIELSHCLLPPQYYVGLAFNIIPEGEAFGSFFISYLHHYTDVPTAESYTRIHSKEYGI
ncbi:MAG: hypothetical protein IJ210_08715, partial [Clostridia bacterium]|nr:hypothetical protein [Clostridia bacterium]